MRSRLMLRNYLKVPSVTSKLSLLTRKPFSLNLRSDLRGSASFFLKLISTDCNCCTHPPIKLQSSYQVESTNLTDLTAPMNLKSQQYIQSQSVLHSKSEDFAIFSCVLQGVLFHWASLRKLKYGKLRLHEVRCSQDVLDTPNFT